MDLPFPSTTIEAPSFHPVALGKGALVATGAPCARQDNLLDWEAEMDIAALWGAQAVITLCNPSERPDILDAEEGLPPLARAVLERRMGWAMLPFPPSAPPRGAVMSAFQEVADIWIAKVRAGGKVWLHDKDGDGRAARALAWWLVRSGVPAAEVWGMIPGWQPIGWEKAWVASAASSAV